MAKLKAEFPDEIFVVNCPFDGTDKYLSAHETAIAAVRVDDRIGELVGVYRLVKTTGMRLKETVEQGRSPRNRGSHK